MENQPISESTPDSSVPQQPVTFNYSYQLPKYPGGLSKVPLDSNLRQSIDLQQGSTTPSNEGNSPKKQDSKTSRIEIKSAMKVLSRMKQDLAKQQKEFNYETDQLVQEVLTHSERQLFRVLQEYNIPLDKLPTIMELGDRIEILQDDLRKKDEELIQLRKVQTQSPQKEAVSAVNDSSTQEIESLRNKISEIEGLLQAEGKEKERLQAQINEIEQAGVKQLLSQQRETEEFKAKIRELESHNLDAILQKDRDISSKDQHILDLGSQLNSVQLNTHELERNYQDSKQHNNKLELDLKDAEKLASALQDEVKSLQDSQKVELEGKSAEHQQSSEEMSKKNKQLIEEIADKNTQIENLNKKISSHHEELGQSIQQYKDQTEKQKTNSKKLESETQELRRNLTSLKEEIKEVRGAKDHEKQTTDENLETLKQQLNDSLTDKASLKEQISSLKQMVEQHKSESNQSELDKIQHQRQEAELNDKIKQLTHQIEELKKMESNNSPVKPAVDNSEINRLKADVHKITQQQDILLSENSSLKDKLVKANEKFETFQLQHTAAAPLTTHTPITANPVSTPQNLDHQDKNDSRRKPPQVDGPYVPQSKVEDNKKKPSDDIQHNNTHRQKPRDERKDKPQHNPDHSNPNSQSTKDSNIEEKQANQKNNDKNHQKSERQNSQEEPKIIYKRKEEQKSHQVKETEKPKSLICDDQIVNSSSLQTEPQKEVKPPQPVREVASIIIAVEPIQKFDDYTPPKDEWIVVTDPKKKIKESEEKQEQKPKKKQNQEKQTSQVQNPVVATTITTVLPSSTPKPQEEGKQEQKKVEKTTNQLPNEEEEVSKTEQAAQTQSKNKKKKKKNKTSSATTGDQNENDQDNDDDNKQQAPKISAKDQEEGWVVLEDQKQQNK